MTAINDLVKMACMSDAKVAGGALSEANEALSSLYGLAYEILDAFLSLELLCM
jgi:hypothetical protein